MRAAFRLPVSILLAACVLVLGGATSRGFQELRAPQGLRPLTVEPDRVEVRMLYHETTVHVTAQVPVGAEVAIVLAGKDRHLALKRKGKVFGVIWMNVGDVAFDSVPDVYLMRSTCDPADMAKPAELRRLGLGLAALRARSGGDARADSLFGELVKLKAHEGLWNAVDDGVTLSPDPHDSGMALATADFILPAKAPPGSYRVSAYAFAGNGLEPAGEGRLEVAQGGVAAFISQLSQRHRLLYGILAVLIAGAAGLLTGVVFGRRARKGH